MLCLHLVDKQHNSSGKLTECNDAVFVYDRVMSNLDSYFPLQNGRTHEAYGPAAHAFAFSLAGHLCRSTDKTILWIRQAWASEHINPVGFSQYFPPQCLLLAQANTHLDALATAEEALRDGSITLVVIELSQPIGLTEGRRLQLAAKEGNTMGLCVLPEGMGSNAAQTRWCCSPVFNATSQATGSTLQRWEIIKNK